MKLGSKSRFTAGEKREALRLVEMTRAQTAWTIRRTLRRLGFPKFRYYDWKQCEERELLEDLVGGARVSPHAILPEEKEAVVEYAPAHEGGAPAHWELQTTMTAAAVRMVVKDALRKTGASPEMVTDNGSQFTAKDFKELVRDFELEHIRIRTYHPESNGRLERFHRSTREELGEQELRNLGQAREIIGRWVSYHNAERLHASLDYLPPAEYWEGDPQTRMKERREKLERGRKRRETIDPARLQKAA